MSQIRKRNKASKPAAEREREASAIRDKLLSIGFPVEHEGVRKVLHALQQFADEGVGSSGTVPLPDWKVCARYKLSLQPHVVSELHITKMP